MSKCNHEHHEHKHKHKHKDDCGHTKVKHNDHYDYLHDGHLYCRPLSIPVINIFIFQTSKLLVVTLL